MNVNLGTNYELIGSGRAGLANGHVAGHPYHYVDVGIGYARGKYKVVVVEHWGTSQGSYLEENDRITTRVRGDDLDDCLARIRTAAIACEMTRGYLEQALSEAEDYAKDFLEPAIAA